MNQPRESIPTTHRIFFLILPYPITNLGCITHKEQLNTSKMRPDGYLKTAWIMTVLFSIILPLHSQTPRQFSIELKDKPLPAALKLIEKEGGKNIIFSYNETESYRVTASIRQKPNLKPSALSWTAFLSFVKNGKNTSPYRKREETYALPKYEDK